MGRDKLKSTTSEKDDIEEQMSSEFLNYFTTNFEINFSIIITVIFYQFLTHFWDINFIPIF
jgi:hypothetical protein